MVVTSGSPSYLSGIAVILGDGSVLMKEILLIMNMIAYKWFLYYKHSELQI